MWSQNDAPLIKLKVQMENTCRKMNAAGALVRTVWLFLRARWLNYYVASVNSVYVREYALWCTNVWMSFRSELPGSRRDMMAGLVVVGKVRVANGWLGARSLANRLYFGWSAVLDDVGEWFAYKLRLTWDTTSQHCAQVYQQINRLFVLLRE